MMIGKCSRSSSGDIVPRKREAVTIIVLSAVLKVLILAITETTVTSIGLG